MSEIKSEEKAESVAPRPPAKKRGRGRPRSSVKRNTREDLIAAAARMFGSAGYQATSLRQIAGAANVDLSTLKYHFTDKSALFTEVFRRGHEALAQAMAGPLIAFTRVATSDELVEAFRHVIQVGLVFMDEHRAFVRLSLYRLLEDADELSQVEAEIEGITLNMINDSLEDLQARGLIREIDTRSLLVLILFGLPIWHVGAATRPSLFGTVTTQGSGWQERAEAFLLTTMTRTLLK